MVNYLFDASINESDGKSDNIVDLEKNWKFVIKLKI